MTSELAAWSDANKSYLEDFIRTTLPTAIGSTSALTALITSTATTIATTIAQDIASPVGTFLLVPDDLTANTGEYVYTDSRTGLTYLYVNGAAVSKTTYAALYAYWGANKWAADSGGNFLLPDTRGRQLVLAGTHADVDVGDVFGPSTESSRRGATHGHAVTALTVTGAPSITDPTKNYVTDASPVSIQLGATAVYVGGSGSATTGVTSGLGTLDVGGTIGTDTNEGGAGIVIGSLVVRF